jgi:hypothetical protein
VFAFSTYVGHLMRAQLNLLLMFWVPLAVYLFLRLLAGELSRRRFVVLFGLVLLGEFLTSTEVFAMATFIGGIVFVTYWLFGSEGLRGRLTRTLVPLAIAYGAAVLVLSPLLIRTLPSTPDTVLRPTEQNSADLVGYVVPGVSTLIGGDALSSVSGRFLDADNFAYFGIAAFAIVVAFANGARRRKGTWILVGLFALTASLAMGPRMHVLGDRVTWLPGWIVSQLPLLQHAVPIRYVMYAWLVLAFIAALWLVDAPSRNGWWRYGLVAFAVVLVLPAQRSDRDLEPVYHETLEIPAFFTDGTYAQHIEPGAIVLAVPRRVGDELLWQVETDMAFRLASAYIGPTKPKNGLGNLSQEEPPPEFDDFVAAVAASDVDVVAADWPLASGWGSFLESATGVAPVVVDNVALYPVSSADPEAT